MRRFALVCTVVALVALAHRGVAAFQSGDPFLEGHRAAVARNLSRVAFEIRFKSGRTTFNPREPIEIELVFDPPSVVDDAPWEAPCRGGWALAAVVIDWLDAVATPRSWLCNDLAERIPLGVLAGVPGGTIGGTPVRLPRVLTLTVNDWYRFDQPGPYRIYVQSAHPTGDGTDHPRETSNVLTFTVTARDPAYERTRQAAATTVLLADAAAATRERTAALKELRRLASNAAAPTLARFYPASELPYDGRDEDVVMGGLLMVPDRAAAVAALEGELRRPERQVSAQFVRDLASLEIARRGLPRRDADGDYLMLVEHYAEERARVLDVVPGRLEAAFREDLIDGGRFEDRFYRGVLGPVTVRHPREVSAAFQSLPAHAQRNLLTQSWRRFADRGFLPLVQRLATSPTDGDDVLRDIALRRWHALAPSQARATLRRELARAQPRVSIYTLALLAERAPRSLQHAWVRLLATSADETVATSAAERLERFGTIIVARAAAAAWNRRHRTLTLEGSAATIAFLLRVDREAGLAALARALSDIPPERPGAGPFYVGLLRHVGGREWSAALEAVAIQALSHPARAVRDDAAELLREFGLPAARQPIEAHLAAANARLAPLANPYPVQRSRHVDDPGDSLRTLASALGQARAWTLRPDEAEAWAARCATHSCTSAFGHEARAIDPSRSIYVSEPLPADEGRRTFTVDGLSVTTESALLEKLGQYPWGTRFSWQDRRWFGPEMERWTAAERLALYQRVRTEAAQAGIVLTQTRTRVKPAVQP